MSDGSDPILTECRLFACRECHTKTGHPHQRWCKLRTGNRPECEDCAYRRTDGSCGHPYKRKGGDAK